MTSQISLPLWLVLIVGALALWSVVDRLLLPGVRFLMRRRFNRAIEDLNTRLKLRIQPFKLAKRQALIDQLIFDPEVLRAVDEYAVANGVTREAAQQRAHRYANEIVPSFSAYAYFGIGTRLARRLSTFLYRVRLGYMDEAAMASADPDAAVILPGVGRPGVVARSLLQRLGVGPLDDDEVDLDRGDLEDRDGPARDVRDTRRRVVGGLGRHPALEVRPQLVLRRPSDEAGSPLMPPDVAGQDDGRGDEQQADGAKGPAPAAPA